MSKDHRRAEQIRAMLEIHARHKLAACEPVGLWLVDQAKREWPRFAALSWWGKTNVPRTRTLVAYHHPAQLCWEWLVFLTFFPRLPRSWRGFIGGRGGRFGSWWVVIPFLIEVRYTSQSYGWMLSGDGKKRLFDLAYDDAELDDAARVAAGVA